MGKEELNNIKKMYKLKMRATKRYMKILFGIAIAFVCADFLPMIINNTSDEHYWILNNNSFTFFLISLLILAIVSFNYNEYKINYMAFPQNNVTRYISSYFVDITVFGTIALFQVMIQLIFYFLITLVSVIDKNIVLINVFSFKTIIAEFVYVLGYFLLFTAIIKLLAVIYRKCIIAFGIIAVVLAIGILNYRNILAGVAAYAKEHNKLYLWDKILDFISAVIGFYKREYNMGLFLLKIVITLIIAFLIGFFIEKKVSDSKRIAYGISQRVGLTIVVAICVFAMPFMGVNVMVNSGSSSKTTTETKTYPLQITDDIKYPDTIENSSDMYMCGIYGVDIAESKKPRIEIERLELDKEYRNKYIKDLFKDCNVSAEVKNGEIYINSNAKKNKYIYISNMYQENNHVRKFLNKNQTADSTIGYSFGSMINSYMTEYRVTVYVPKKNIVEDNYSAKIFINGKSLEDNFGYEDDYEDE